jgi:hypothetical protein
MPKGITLDELPERYRKQAELQLADAGRKNTSKNAKPEHDSHEALEKHSQATQISARVYIVVLCYRTGIRWDIDNVSIKPFLDGIVERKLLKDDSTKQIEGIIKLARRCKTKAEERTEIEFWNADYFGPYIEAARREAEILRD